MVIIIPKGLNTKQALMYNALMRCKEADMTKKWHYNPSQFLIGRKKTNSRTGEVKVTFSTEPRISKPLEFLKEIEEEEKLKTIIEAMLKLRIGELERDIEAMKARKKAQELLLIKHLEAKKRK